MRDSIGVARARRQPPQAPPGPTKLPPLRWVAEHELLYEAEANTVHRPGCARIAAVDPTRVPAGSSLRLVWAPQVCACRPDMTLALGRD